MVRLAEPRTDADPVYGFAASERSIYGRRHWFALYRSNDAIIFQTGTSKWAVADTRVEFRHTRPHPFASEFEVRVDGQLAFSIRYPHLSRLLFALIDPTYDKIDQESDYLLEFVSENANSRAWRDNVLGQWRSEQAT
jgi:hypothetical protein